jgi:hypothetical protein
MSEAQQLKDNYEKALAELQERCLHTVKHWAMESWAPVHYTGWEVEVCDNCWKQLQKRQGTSYIVPVGKLVEQKDRGKGAKGLRMRASKPGRKRHEDA